MLSPEELQREAWTWSFSKFSRFQECNEFYRLKYFDKLKIPPLSEKPFFQGRIAHKLTEQTFAKWQRGEVTSMQAAWDDHEALFDHYANSIPWGSDQEIIQARLESQKLLANYLRLIEEAGLTSGVVACEFWFGTYEKPLIRPSGLRWVGAIDWLKMDYDGARAWIWDGKSSQTMQYLDKRQLIMYAMAVEQLYGLSVPEVGYLMMRWDKPLIYTVTKQEKADLEAEMIRASMAAEAGAFSVSPNVKQCASCQFNPHCGIFKNWILTGAGRSGEVDW